MNDWTHDIGPPGLGSRIRVGAKLVAFFALTLPLMPVQAALARSWPHGARRFPHWYHRQVCRLIGVRVRTEGELARGASVLLIANHASWLDIPVISAAAPVSFVAKKEVAGWPFVSWLAKLQRTVFVDRKRRTTVGETASEMTERLARGDNLVLFAEGTSSDGGRVLPFKTSLLAAAKPVSRRTSPHDAAGAPEGSGDVTVVTGSPQPGRDLPHESPVVQTLAIVYTHIHGLPIGRADRPLVGWYGDMSLPDHVWRLIESGPVDVTVRLGPPVPLVAFCDRKALARHGEERVRADVVDLLRGGRKSP
jgi:1-acyl-sn-glycerol-3-phosphate acyltransferase